MNMVCDSGESGEPCKACQQSRDASKKLYQDMVEYIKDKNLTDSQQVQCIMLAALTSVEIIANKKNHLEAAAIVISIMNNWVEDVVESQSRELQKNNSVANVIRGNRTVN